MFADRLEAGQRLGAWLRKFRAEDCAPGEYVVLALPRGGVPVGYEVARALGVPLDVFVVRKLGAPSQPELAMGAIASGGVRVINREVVRALRITPEEVEAATQREAGELERREKLYRSNRPPVAVRGRCVLLIDDGIATGSTMRAAAEALRQLGPKRIIVAVPVAAEETCRDLEGEADAVVCLFTPSNFAAVGQWYRRFEQTSDEEVRNLLSRSVQEDGHDGI